MEAVVHLQWHFCPYTFARGFFAQIVAFVCLLHELLVAALSHIDYDAVIPSNCNGPMVLG